MTGHPRRARRLDGRVREANAHARMRSGHGIPEVLDVRDVLLGGPMEGARSSTQAALVHNVFRFGSGRTYA